MRTLLSTLAAGIGLALSLWLAASKVWPLPCFHGDCEAVLRSSYGAILGIPVGAFGAALWTGVFAARGPRARQACLGLLALGSVVFIALQAFVLKAFCPLCMAHAVACWIAAAVCGRNPPRPWGAAGAVVLAAAGVLAATALARHPPESGDPALAALAREQADAIRWLGERGPDSPVLVLSLTCPDCLKKLSALTRLDYSRNAAGPALYFKTDADSLGLTTAFVAAVLARPGDRRDAFLALAGFFLSQRDRLPADPADAADALRSLLPAPAPARAEAAALLARQADRLKAARVRTTPLLIRPDGTATAVFAPRDLFQ
jgi:hypothetical protein